MSNITIVTAFFDIGRNDWTVDKGYPHYLQRSVDTYVERFARLAKLDNELIVYTSADLVDKIASVCGNRPKTKIITFDVQKEFKDMRDAIEKVQQMDSYKQLINPAQIKNPEYWNPDYVLVTNLKAFFTNLAIQQHGVENDLVAWIDFGYCRYDSNIPPSKTWEYDFNPELIHLFSYKDYSYDRPISDIIANNDVHILGAKVVAHKDKWDVLEKLMWHSFNELIKYDMIDDDQGLWLVSYLLQPKIFELHKIPDHQLGHDPFVLFNDFNKTV
jgi:protein YibB